MKEIYMSNHLKDTVAKHNRMIGLIGLGAAAAGALLADPVTGIVPIMAGAAMANVGNNNPALKSNNYNTSRTGNTIDLTMRTTLF